MVFCLVCDRVRCLPCSGIIFERPAPVIICKGCRSGRLEREIFDDAAADDAIEARLLVRRLGNALQMVLSRQRRVATRRQYAAGINKLLDFGIVGHLATLPSTPDVLWGFIMYSLVVQDLDSTTISGHLASISGWRFRCGTV